MNTLLIAAQNQAAFLVLVGLAATSVSALWALVDTGYAAAERAYRTHREGQLMATIHSSRGLS